MSTAHRHCVNNVIRKVLDSGTGRYKEIEVPRPVTIEKYNYYMGGVDKSDQYLAYHNVLRKTVRYWKTLFYHLVDIAAVNSFILYNLIAHMSGCRLVTENDFRDELVLQIIERYGKDQREKVCPGRPSRSDCRVRHGSTISSSMGRCQYCKLAGQSLKTYRKCLDCLYAPVLCQTAQRDCHAKWHEPSFDNIRDLWFRNKEASNQQLRKYLVNPNVVVVVPKVLKTRRNIVEITVLHCEQLKLFSLYFYITVSLLYVIVCFTLCLKKNVCYLWYVITGNLNGTKVEIVER